MLFGSLLQALFFWRVGSKEIEIPNLHGYRRTLMNDLNDKMNLISKDVQGLLAGPFLKNYHAAMTLAGQLDLMCYSRALMKRVSDDTFNELASAKLRLNSYASRMLDVVLHYFKKKASFYKNSLAAMDAFMTVTNKLSLRFLGSLTSHDEETLIIWFRIFNKLGYSFTSLDLRLTSSTTMHQAEEALLSFFIENINKRIIGVKELKKVLLSARKGCTCVQSSIVRFRSIKQNVIYHQARITTLILNSN